MSIDLGRTKLLLDVVHATAAAGPGYNNLMGTAIAELKAMDDEAAKEIAKVKAEADKKAAAEAAAKAKAEVEKAKADEAKGKDEKTELILEPASDVGRKI